MLGPSRFGWARLIVVGGFVFDGWLCADFAVQALVVEPVDVRQRGPFDVVGVLPGSFVVDEFMAAVGNCRPSSQLDFYRASLRLP